MSRSKFVDPLRYELQSKFAPEGGYSEVRLVAIPTGVCTNYSLRWVDLHKNKQPLWLGEEFTFSNHDDNPCFSLEESKSNFVASVQAAFSRPLLHAGQFVEQQRLQRLRELKMTLAHEEEKCAKIKKEIAELETSR